MKISLEDVISHEFVSAFDVCCGVDTNEKVFVVGLKDGSHISAEVDKHGDSDVKERNIFKLTLHTNGTTKDVGGVKGADVSKQILGLIESRRIRAV